jgi:hypothetical protein
MDRIMANLSDRCGGCGLVVPGGTDGCQAIFDELLARDFNNALYFKVHRLMVDLYALQHPDRYCASAKSFAAHLTGLCFAIENKGNRAVGYDPLRRWLDGSPHLERPPVPAHRGDLTIADVRSAPDPEAYANAVDRWANSTWVAYAELQPLARQWIETALTPRARHKGHA